MDAIAALDGEWRQTSVSNLDEFLAASDALLASNPARSILLVGGPGSGKGTICKRLVAECGVSHVSCGDMLREEVAADTPLGKECSAIMQRGELVSSELIVTLLRRRMRRFGGRRLLLDGFPRSKQNAIDFITITIYHLFILDDIDILGHFFLSS